MANHEVESEPTSLRRGAPTVHDVARHAGVSPMTVSRVLSGGKNVRDEMKAKGKVKPVVASLAGDVEVEEAAQYLYENGIPAYAYSTELPVEVLGAKYQWARAAGLL